MFLPHFDVFCDLLLNKTHGYMESISFISKRKAVFISKYFNITRKPAFCPAFALPLHDKNLWSIQNETISLVAMHSKELWLIEKNRATVKPDSSVAPRWMKTYSESRIELRNLQILKKMLKQSSQFLSSEQPCKPKSLDVVLKITGVEKIPSENLWLRST